MLKSVPALALLLAFALTADEIPQPWTKDASQWTDDEAKLILSNSPWAQVVTPEISYAQTGQRRSGGGMGRGGGMGGGGIGIGGIGIGMPGGRRGGGGGGYPGGGRNGGGGNYPAPQQQGDVAPSQKLPTLTLRWESAAPIREAELKAHYVDAPSIEDKYYAIAVYGIPNRISANDSNDLKKQVKLLRDGKKDIKADRVKVIARDEGLIVVYLFSHSKEISQKDTQVTFDATIGRLHVVHSFSVEDMVYHGKLEI